MIPAVLEQVREHLSGVSLDFKSGRVDARVDSARWEVPVISAIQQKAWDFAIDAPNVASTNNRAWYDVKIADYFCNIKISALNTADNTNAQMAIFYILTGRYPRDRDGFSVPSQGRGFFPLMKKHESPDEGRDYYYIVVNKNDTSDVFVVSLKGVRVVVPASNNFPFQCRWGENRQSVQRNWQEAKDFLLQKYATSIQRKIDSLSSGMPQYYAEYFRSSRTDGGDGGII